MFPSYSLLLTRHGDGGWGGEGRKGRWRKRWKRVITLEEIEADGGRDEYGIEREEARDERWRWGQVVSCAVKQED